MKVLGILNTYYQDNPPTDEANLFNQDVAEKVTDAVFEVSGIAKKEEPQDEVMKVLFRGDYHDFPEHLWDIARCLRDTWLFVLPDKPQKSTKKAKSQYALFCLSMEDIKTSCAEHGVKALEETHTKWRAAFKDGIAPYTVATPASLINVVAATAREMREQESLPKEVTRLL
jgi:hypothetical protein